MTMYSTMKTADAFGMSSTVTQQAIADATQLKQGQVEVKKIFLSLTLIKTSGLNPT